MREIVSRFGIDPVLTPQQDLLLTGIEDRDRATIESLLVEHGVRLAHGMSKLERFTLACPALPTCGLALTEAERVRAPFVEQMDAALHRHGLEDRDISFRITGCPNGCVRTYTGDIGLVGRMPGHYAVYVGGDFAGTRLSFRLLDRVREADVVPTLDILFESFAAEAIGPEGFGDWCSRRGAESLLAILEGRGAAPNPAKGEPLEPIT